MEEEVEIQEEDFQTETTGKGYKLLLALSVLSFVVSLILLWQGLVKMSNASTQYETLRRLVYALFTFNNSGVELLLISFFLLIISIQLSIYAIIAKKGK